ncbi:MAG: hypothetical protein NTY99_03345, partial [DPANN group archaeon]|nr:hypothetical protein [DPANN group archaeon]
ASKGTLLVELLLNKAGALGIRPKDEASEITNVNTRGTDITKHIEVMEADSAGMYLVIDNHAYQVNYKFSKTPSQ